LDSFLRHLALFFLLLTPGCVERNSPVGVTRALAELAESGAQMEVFGLLGPATRRQLEEEARRTAASSGRRSLLPEELLAVGWGAPRYRAIGERELWRHGDEAAVEVRGASGEREVVRCVREGGFWKIELH
jgi:hypothetical protein